MVAIAIDTEERPIRYAARQPILAIDETVIGYKLLFRTNVKDHFSGSETNQSSRTAIDASSLLGLNILSDNRMAFIGCTRDVLLENVLHSLPADMVVVDIAPDVAPDEEVQNAIRSLKEAGYKIALDDFSLDDPREALIGFADFLKVDIKARTPEELGRIARKHGNHRVGLIADKVESWSDFEQSQRVGFHYFQGFYFRRPETMRTRMATAHQATYLRLLQAVSRPEMDWDEVEDFIKSDAAIYFRLMRYINSPMMGVRHEIRSVTQALVLMGENELRRWCRMAGAFEMSKSRPSDLMLAALIRARFGELLGAHIEHGEADLFLLGLLSLMDSIMEIPMGVVIEGLPLDDSSRELLLEHTGPLQPLYELILEIERGAWGPVVRLCHKLGVPEEEVAADYTRAMQWTQAINAPS